MAEDAGVELSEDTLGYLEETKKGKLRKFVLISKGNSIVSLIVYKKGNLEKYKKEAKASGKGSFSFGVVSGRGSEVTFSLATADGFTQAPVKNTVLKSTLAAAEFNCKPQFVIVSELPLALDEADPLVARFLGLKALATPIIATSLDSATPQIAELSSLLSTIPKLLESEDPDSAVPEVDRLDVLVREYQASPAAATSSAAEDNRQTTEPMDQTNVAPSSSQRSETEENPRLQQLTDALKKLRPAIDEIITQLPLYKSELVSALSASVLALKARNFDSAYSSFLGLAKRIKELKANLAASKTSENAANAENDLAAQDFATRRQAFEELLQRAQAVAPNQCVNIVNAFQLVLKQSQTKGPTIALQSLDRLEQVLQKLLATPPASASTKDAPSSNSSSVDALEQEYQQRYNLVQPRWQLAVEGGFGDTSKLRAAMAFVTENAESGEFARALQALAKLSPAIDAALAQGEHSGIAISDEAALLLAEWETGEALPEDVVEFRKAMVQWNAARSSIETQIAAVKVIGGKKHPQRLNAFDKLDVIITNFNVDLVDLLDKVVTAPTREDRAYYASNALVRTEEYLELVNNNWLVEHADRNPFAKIAVRKTLVNVLEPLADRLAEAAQYQP